MNFLHARANVGDDGALGDLPITIERSVAEFVDADSDAMEIARDVVAVIDANEFAAKRVAVAMFDQNLFAGIAPGRIEIHGEVFAIESECGEGDALGGLGLGDLNGRWIFNYFGGIVEGL